MLKAKSFREQLRQAKLGNDFYADMAGKPRLETHSMLSKPIQHRTRDTDRISEADVNETIREFSAQRDDITLWRNNRGVAIGANGTPVRVGVGPNGASDWIGYRQLLVTPEMIGFTICQFLAVEAKAPDAGKPDDAQIRFIEHINKVGGKAIIARERKDLEKL